MTFPEKYHVADLAEKPAVFKVTIKEIKVKELPEINDEFAGEVSDFETLDEYKADIKAKLLKTKEKQAITENENRVVEKVVAGATMEIPEPMIETQVQTMINDYARRIQGQGMSFSEYLKFTGTSIEQLKNQARPQAERTIRTRLVLETVAKTENIQVSEEKLEEEIKNMANAYRIDVERAKQRMGEEGLEQMKEDLAVQEAVDFLVAEAKLV